MNTSTVSELRADNEQEQREPRLPTRLFNRARAVMLVSNSCVNDTRVIRAAETVSEHGFDTIVLAVAQGGETSEERRNGVLYKRLAKPWVQAQPRVQAQSPQAPKSAISTISTYALIRTYLVAHTIWVVLDPYLRGDRRVVRGPLRALLNSNRLRRRAAYLNSSIPKQSLGFFQVAMEIGRRVIRFFGCRVIRFAFFFGRRVVETRRWHRMFEPELRKLKPSVIHAHDLVMLPAAAAAAKSLGAKLIYDSHELEVHRNTKTGRLDKWLRYYLERRHIRGCDAVITVCDSIADHLARAYAIRRPVVVMNAPDAEQTLPCESDLRSRLGLARETPLGVYVGRITIGRGIEQTVSSLQYLPEFHLALVGPVNEPTVAAAMETARTLGIAERIHVLDPVPPNMVISFIGSSDVSVVPIQNVCLSYYYCLPNKLLESAIAGLPVVVSNLPELRRFVEISGSGVVMDETDPRDIARAIREAYENRHLLRPSTESLRRVEEIYGWPKQKKALKALYASFDLLPTEAPAQAVSPAFESGVQLRA